MKSHRSLSTTRSYQNAILSLLIVAGSLTIAAGITLLFLQSIHHTSEQQFEDLRTQLLRPSQWESVVVHSNGANLTPSVHSCHHHSCFDVYRCGRTHHSHITVYVYPMAHYIDEDEVEINPISKEFLEIVEAVVNSRYYTSDPRDACVFFPTIDMLNENNLRKDMIGRALSGLKYWNEGSNHLLFNFLPGSAPHFVPRLGVERGKALVAGAGFSSHTYRRNFDISLPVFNPAYNDRPITKNTIEDRPWYFVSSQVNIHREYYDELLAQVPQDPMQRDLLLLHLCSESVLQRLQRRDTVASAASGAGNAVTFSKLQYRCRGEQVFPYPQVLEESQFCLVSRGGRLGQAVLYDALRAGCVPVVVADTLVLPLSQVLDWRVASVQLYEDDLPELLTLLKRDVSSDRLRQLQRQVVWLYSRYFSSVGKLAVTALDLLNERVFPLQRRPRHLWIRDPLTLPSDNPLFLPLTAPASEGFTAVVLTYDRLDSLQQVIQTLSRVPSCKKVLVVWNNQKKDPPATLSVGSLPVEVVRPPENRLSNRFFPYNEITTQAILSLDDDINMMTPDELEFGYQVWREFPDRLVGYPSRNVIWSNTSHSWKYDSEWTNEVSMVLTGAAFYHKYWSHVYTTELLPLLRDWVDQHMNCEDIAMNFLVANRTGKAPVKVTPRKKFKCSTCSAGDLSATEAHMLERSGVRGAGGGGGVRGAGSAKSAGDAGGVRGAGGVKGAGGVGSADGAGGVGGPGIGMCAMFGNKVMGLWR
ncbi:Exostosin C-terminal [Trinorchestia longiramus]|nr:Exostosin C-terminal [Trinorchestia longiramus]